MTESQSQNLILRMVEQLPELRPLLDEHLEDQEGELLPYLLLGDVARWSHERAPHAPDQIQQLLQFFECEFVAGDPDVKNLISVGFVEMLPETPRGDAVLNLLGPQLRQEALEMNLFEPWPASDPSS